MIGTPRLWEGPIPFYNGDMQGSDRIRTQLRCVVTGNVGNHAEDFGFPDWRAMQEAKQRGDLVEEPVTQFREPDAFYAVAEIENVCKYSGSINVQWRFLDGPHAGALAPMFATEFDRIVTQVTLVKGKVSGKWGFRKQGTAYGVVLVEEAP